jgi:hypothetical protein
MDPLSLTVSTVTLLTAVRAIAKKIKAVHNAGNGLRAVLHGLSDFDMLLRQIKSLIEEYGSNIPEVQLSDLSALLEKATTKFSELDMITQKHVARLKASGKIKASKMAWTRELSTIRPLQDSLKDIMQKLSTLLSNMSL